MRDEDYIPAGERPASAGGMGKIAGVDLLSSALCKVSASHAVADDVMRELAELVQWLDRRLWDYVNGKGFGDGPHIKAATEAALARYDRLVGGNDE